MILRKRQKVFLFNLTVKKRPNILVVGPISGDKNQEIVFPVLSPDPATNKDVNFLNYPVYVGGNRGRGQVYPTGEKSNNNSLHFNSCWSSYNQLNLEKKVKQSLRLQQLMVM